MKLQEKLNAMKEEHEANVPHERLAILQQANEELIQSGIADKVINVGETLPEFTLSDEKGNAVSSKNLLAKGPLAISFYRGVWWRYCNAELEALQEVYGQVQELGGSIIAISPQLSKYSKQVVKKHKLTYPVLSDIENVLAKKLGVTFTFPKKLKELYLGAGTDLERFNGNDSWVMPMSGRFVIDSQGVIRSTEVHPDYTIRPESTDIVKLIKSIA